jgi:hypothetical protein
MLIQVELSERNCKRKDWTNELLIPQDNQTQYASSSVISIFK